jgi:hypothetical protein
VTSAHAGTPAALVWIAMFNYVIWIAFGGWAIAWRGWRSSKPDRQINVAPSGDVDRFGIVN